MKPSTLIATMTARIQNGVTRAALIEGPPGLGKTQIMQQIADQLGIECRILHAPLMQPEDYGMPVVSVDRSNVKFVVPTAKFPIVGSDAPEQGILVLDELPQADNASQKILANLIQAREIHGYQIKPGWTIIATGNRAADRAGANRLLSHLRNRLTTYEFTPNLDDWCDWYLQQDDCKYEGLAFLRFRPELLSKFDPHQDINPTPRAWVEGVFAALGKVPREAEAETFKGDVGEGPAAEFLGFLQIYRSLPKIEDVLKNPDTIKLPKDAATWYALASALAQRAEVDNFAQIWIFAQRMSPEYRVLLMRDATKRNTKLASTKEFATWASTEGMQVTR